MKEESRPLWAPWRISFIRSKKEQGCFMCNNKEARESSPEEELIVARYQHCFVILNRYPYNSGHLLIAPYRHIGDIAALETEEAHEIMDVCIKAKKVLQKVMSPQAYNVGFNLGAAAGAGVAEHLHLHIVPRWNGDNNFMPVIGDIGVVPEALRDTAGLLRKEWK